MGIKEVQRANGQIKFHADVRVGSAPRKYGTFDTRKDAETFIAITEASARKAIRASAQSSFRRNSTDHATNTLLSSRRMNRKYDGRWSHQYVDVRVRYQRG